jgi:hypothetical protein
MYFDEIPDELNSENRIILNGIPHYTYSYDSCFISIAYFNNKKKK